MLESIVDVKTVETLPASPSRAGRKPELAAMAAGRKKRPVEHREDYPHIVAVLDAKTRVIECADRIQWIVQRRTGSLDRPWAGRSFCTSKQALLRIAGRHPLSGREAALEALPDYFPEIA
jgi:hypothetical protein